jgi:hypothetical protein
MPGILFKSPAFLCLKETVVPILPGEDVPIVVEAGWVILFLIEKWSVILDVLYL